MNAADRHKLEAKESRAEARADAKEDAILKAKDEAQDAREADLKAKEAKSEAGLKHGEPLTKYGEREPTNEEIAAWRADCGKANAKPTNEEIAAWRTQHGMPYRPYSELTGEELARAEWRSKHGLHTEGIEVLSLAERVRETDVNKGLNMGIRPAFKYATSPVPYESKLDRERRLERTHETKADIALRKAHEKNEADLRAKDVAYEKDHPEHMRMGYDRDHPDPRYPHADPRNPLDPRDPRQTYSPDPRQARV